MVQAGETGIARLIREEPKGMSKGRRELVQCCEDIQSMCGFEDFSRFIVAGFSQVHNIHNLLLW